jgi:signal transduction histidine kinase
MRVGEIGSDLHSLSRGLHPSTLQTFGLVGAIDALCRDMARMGLTIKFRHRRPHEAGDIGAMLCLYRVTQEALHNTARHGRAREATVSLSGSSDYLCLHVNDKGVGFDPQALEHQGLGLLSMRERVSYLGGQLVIRTAPGKGTQIGVRMPRRPSIHGAPQVSRSA